jgi:beta-glucosidase
LPQGISYTQFTYSGLFANDISAGDAGSQIVVVAFSVTNSGSVAGVETPQLYLRFPPEAGEPPKQLKGFESTSAFTLAPRDFSIWDVETHSWAVARGEFEVMVGASSCDIRQRATVTINW